MKILAAGIAAAAFSFAPALAADMPVKTPPPAAAPVFNWSGFYAGIEGGWGRAQDRIELAGGALVTPIFTPSLHDTGGLVGGTLGYNWQSGSIVFGVEGDASWADIDPTGHDATVFPICTAGGLGVCGTKLSSLETVRGRVGFTNGSVLVYATGGAAFGDLKTTISNTGVGAIGASKSNSGWAAGGGIEALLGRNWTAKIEYLHIDLGDGPWFANSAEISRSVGWKANIVRVGLNYKFDWGKSPVVAKY